MSHLLQEEIPYWKSVQAVPYRRVVIIRQTVGGWGEQSENTRLTVSAGARIQAKTGNAHTSGPVFRGIVLRKTGRRSSSGQKTPPFAGAKRRGRNREEAKAYLNEEINLPWLPCQYGFCKS